MPAEPPFPSSTSLEEFSISSSSPDATFLLARKIGSRASAGEVFTLEGGLSAGKTLFARGFAQGMGIGESVTSPTFPIIQEYDGEPPLYHMDLYRLGGSEEFIDIGGEELLFDRGICLIEWPDRAEELLPASRIRVHLEITGEMERLIRFRGPGKRLREITHDL